MGQMQFVVLNFITLPVCTPLMCKFSMNNVSTYVNSSKAKIILLYQVSRKSQCFYVYAVQRSFIILIIFTAHSNIAYHIS